MHPVLLRLGPLTISSYGLLLGLSFILGLWLAVFRAKRMGLDPARVIDAAFWIVLCSMIGARLYSFFLHFKEYGGDPVRFFLPLKDGGGCAGGLVMYGGYIGGLLACLVFFKVKKLPFLPYADAIAPSFAAGMFLTRIGCFLNGCCFGLPTSAWYGLHFPVACPAGEFQALRQAPKLLPSQLLLSAGGLLIVVLVLTLEKRANLKGFSFYLVGGLTAVLSFAVDFTRFYPRQEKMWFLAHNQILSLALLVLFSGLMIRAFVRRRGA